jgi:hypothetical protein
MKGFKVFSGSMFRGLQCRQVEKRNGFSKVETST